MRFDNPIINHKIRKMPDISQYNEVKEEYCQKRKVSLLKLNYYRKSKNLKKFNSELNKIIALTFKEKKRDRKEYKLEKVWRKKLNRYFKFYNNFRVRSKKIDNKIFNDLYKNGYSFRSLNEESIKYLRKKLSNKIKKLLNKPPKKPKDYIKILPAAKYDRFLALGKTYIKYVNKIFEEAGINEAASAYYNKKMNVKRVSLMVKKKTDNSPKQFLFDCKKLSLHTNLHRDPLEGAVKAILYLDKVKKGNGETCYLPSSNRFVYDPLQDLFSKAISTGSYCFDKISRRSVFRLPKKLRVTTNFGRMVKDGSKLQKYLSKNIAPLTSDKGNVMIFDPHGIHNGPIVKRGLRISLDIVLS